MSVAVFYSLIDNLTINHPKDVSQIPSTTFLSNRCWRMSLCYIYRGSLFSIFNTLIYHKVLINNKTEPDTEQDTTYKNINGTVYIHSNTIYINSITMSNAWWKHENISKEQNHTITQVCPDFAPTQGIADCGLVKSFVKL